MSWMTMPCPFCLPNPPVAAESSCPGLAYAVAIEWPRSIWPFIAAWDAERKRLTHEGTQAWSQHALAACVVLWAEEMRKFASGAGKRDVITIDLGQWIVGDGWSAERAKLLRNSPIATIEFKHDRGYVSYVSVDLGKRICIDPCPIMAVTTLDINVLCSRISGGVAALLRGGE